jgi:hypothetical protein
MTAGSRIEVPADHEEIATVDVRIGVTDTPREIEVELAENADVDQVVAGIEASLGAERGVLWLTDKRGRRVGVPAGKVAYIELSATHDERRVGFGAAVK